MKNRTLLAIILAFVSLLPLQAQTAPAAKDPNAVDLEMVGRIRNEALRNSQVMDTLWHIADGIGPRLTNSPNARKANAWTRDQLTKWGLENAHLEPWGPFGRGWSYQESTVRMTAPDTAEYIALPKAYTPGTDGPLKGKAIRVHITSKEDFEKYKGKLKGAIVVIGEEREIKLKAEPLSERFSDKELAELAQFNPAPVYGNYTPAQLQQRVFLSRDLQKFLAEEQPAVVLEPSRSPGDGGTVFVQGGGSYKKGEPVGPPNLVMNYEHWARIARMLDHKMDVELEVNVRTTFYDDDEYGYNTIAELPGSDPVLKNEIVMMGAHLDSWHGGTGATDDGGPIAAVMEAMRILKAVGAKPRRTIRVALWTGEEQGLLGSKGYVDEHFGVRPPDPEQKDRPSYMITKFLPVQPKPDYEKLAAYFNLDDGVGKVRGIYTMDNPAVVPIFEKWMEPFHDLGMNTITNRRTGGSDFLSYDTIGLPGFPFIQDGLEYDTRTHHSNMDTYERVPAADLMQASAILASFAYNAAMRDEKLPHKFVPMEAPAPVKPDDAKKAAKKEKKK